MARRKTGTPALPRAAIVQLGKMSDPKISAQHGIPLAIVRAERIVRGIKRVRRGGRPTKAAGVAQTELLGLTMTPPELAEIAAAVPQGETRGRWVVEAALMRARAQGAPTDASTRERDEIRRILWTQEQENARRDPELAGHDILVHAGHYTGGGGHDLARWIVRHPEQPTRAQLRTLGVPDTAEYHSGHRRDDVQHWIYVERRPMSPATCERCG